MSFDYNLEGLENLQFAEDRDFIFVVVENLARYDIRKAAFNFAADSNVAITVQDKMYLIAPEGQPYIRAAEKVLDEYSVMGYVSTPVREKYIIEHVKNDLRDLPISHDTAEYKKLCDHTMSQVIDALHGVGSLALFTPQAPKYRA